MLYILHSLVVFPFFGLLMLLVDGSNVFGTVIGGIWVKHPYVKECVLYRVPKTTCFYAQASLGTDNRRSVGESLSTQRLKGKLSCNVVTVDSRLCLCFVVSQNREASAFTRHGMIN